MVQISTIENKDLLSGYRGIQLDAIWHVLVNHLPEGAYFRGVPSSENKEFREDPTEFYVLCNRFGKIVIMDSKEHTMAIKVEGYETTEGPIPYYNPHRGSPNSTIDEEYSHII